MGLLEGNQIPELLQEEEENKAAAEIAYREAREKDAMFKEEQDSIDVENDYERRLRDVFHTKLVKCIEGAGVTSAQVDELKLLARSLRRISVIEEFADNGCSWNKLQERVFQTLAAEEEAKILAERLKTEQGRDRQKKILEHAEDIEEMTDFFRKDCNLSRTNARRAATECVMKNICTPKKLAKVWARNDLDLEKQLHLDEDDAEDVAIALKNLHTQALMKTNSTAAMSTAQSMGNMSMTQGSGTGSMQDTNSFYQNPATAQSWQQPAYDPAAEQQQQQYTAEETAAWEAQQAQQQQQDQTQYDENGWPIDPATGLAYDPNAPYDQSQEQQYTAEETAAWEAQQAHEQQQAYELEQQQQQQVAAQQPQQAQQSALPEGWYEAYTEDGYMYYYNEATGESSWEWPGGDQASQTGYDNQQQGQVAGTE